MINFQVEAKSRGELAKINFPLTCLNSPLSSNFHLKVNEEEGERGEIGKTDLGAQ